MHQKLKNNKINKKLIKPNSTKTVCPWCCATKLIHAGKDTEAEVDKQVTGELYWEFGNKRAMQVVEQGPHHKMSEVYVTKPTL